MMEISLQSMLLDNRSAPTQNGCTAFPGFETTPRRPFAQLEFLDDAAGWPAGCRYLLLYGANRVRRTKASGRTSRPSRVQTLIARTRVRFGAGVATGRWNATPPRRSRSGTTVSPRVDAPA